MSQYNGQPDSTADNAASEAFAPELAPFLPTTDQSEGWSPPIQAGTGQPVGNTAALPPDVEFVSLHAKVEFTGVTPALVHCLQCSASFSNDHQLGRHATKSKHKAYLCTCEKGFTKLSALKRHVEESTQARKHQCPLCDNEFKRPGHVEQHLRLVHKKPNDVIKDLLSAQKSQPRRESGPASTASSAVPTTGHVDAQADYPVANPSEPWTGPIDFSAPTPADYPGSRPVDSSVSLPAYSAPSQGQMTGAPAFAPQSFMTQTPDLPAYPGYPAGAVNAQTGFPANPAQDFAGYPAANSNGYLDFLNMDPDLVFANPADGFEMSALETGSMGEFYDFDLNTF